MEILSGDIVDMHLGLAGPEYQRLVDETTHIFHLAAISYLGMPHEVARKVNVDGTRAVLELARECTPARALRALQHLLRVGRSRRGDRRRRAGAGPGASATPTKRRSTRPSGWCSAAKASLPVTIIRPSTVVGDSATGEIDRFEGPYYLGMLLVLSPLVLPLPLPGNGVAPLNVVPVDFVVQATWVLAQKPEAIGKTVHLVDPNPMSARRVYELIAERANKKLPRFTISARATDLFLRIPGVEKLARPQRAAIALRESPRALQLPHRPRAARRHGRALPAAADVPGQADRLRHAQLESTQDLGPGRDRRPARSSRAAERPTMNRTYAVGDTFTLVRACEPYRPIYYAAASGDFNPIHIDPEVGREAGLGGAILQGLCTLGWAVDAFIGYLGDPGRVAGIKVRFSRPVAPHDVVTFTGTVKSVENGRLVAEIEATNQRGEDILKGAVVEGRV